MITIVTGAAGALGSAVVAYLCERGGHVLAVDRDGSQKALADLAARWPAKCETAAFDVADRTAWTQATARLQGRGVEGAALIAGSWAGGASVGSGGDTWRKLMSVNTDTVYSSLEALLPLMTARGTGSVVVVGSRVVERPEQAKTSAEYAASKAAVVALAQSVAADVISHGVRVNAVLPSVIDTPANRKAMPSADYAQWVAPTSLAQVIGFLLSDAAKDVTGAAIPVYGRA